MTTLELSNSAKGNAEYEIVVLGGGFAGGHFIAEYIEKGGSGTDICLVSAEGVYPYERSFLSKGFLLTAEKLAEHHTASKTEDWYNAHGITVLLNSPCTKVDIKNKTIHYQDKNGLVVGVSWRKGLVIATGSKTAPSISIPGNHTKGCHKLLNYTDGLSLRNTLEKCRGGKAVVLGGECLHMDIMEALTTSWDMSVTCVLEESQLFPALFTKEISKVYEDKLEEMGTTIYKETTITQVVSKDSTIIGVQLSNKKGVECDVLIYGNCAMPNIDLFGDQLEYINEPPGIQVDENMCTSVEGVYAIGEVAVLHVRPNYTDTSQTMNCRDAEFAKMMAKHLARTMRCATAPVPYIYFPDLRNTLYDLNWRFCGLVSPDCTVEYKYTDSHIFAAWLENQKLVAALVMVNGNSALESIALQAVKTQVRLRTDDLTDSASVSAFITKVLKVRTEQQATAREQAILAVPTLKVQVEQAALQLQRTQRHLGRLQGELTRAQEEQKRKQWYVDTCAEEPSLNASCKNNECMFGLDLEPESDDEEPRPRTARDVLCAAAYTLLNAFTFTGTQFLFYREVFVMHPFPYLTSLVNAVLSFAISGVLYLVLRGYSSSNPEMRRSALLTLPMKPLMVLGVLFAITNVIQVAAIDALGPSNVNVATLLNQFTVPFTAIGGYLFNKSRYGILQIIGCSLVVSGVVVFVGREPSEKGLSMSTFSIWIVTYSITCLVQACFDIVTQRLFGEATRPVTMLDVLYLVLLMNLGSVLLAPLVSMLFGLVATTDVNSLINEDYGDGMVCLSTGNTSSSMNLGGSGDWWLTTQCEYAWVWVLGFNLGNVAYIIINTVVVMRGGPSCQFIALLISLPILNVILSNDTLMGGNPGTTYSLLWVGIVLVTFGMVLHEHKLLGFSEVDTEEEEYLLRQSPTSIQMGDQSSPCMSVENRVTVN